MESHAGCIGHTSVLTGARLVHAIRCGESLLFPPYPARVCPKGHDHPGRAIGAILARLHAPSCLPTVSRFPSRR